MILSPQGTFSNVWRHFWFWGGGSSGLYQGEAKDAAKHLQDTAQSLLVKSHQAPSIRGA